VASGFTPMEAIQAATIVPARVMHLRRVRLVVANGRRYDPAPLWRSVGFTP
jgi:imidazolonepropionase-like amidohydrolase